MLGMVEMRMVSRHRIRGMVGLSLKCSLVSAKLCGDLMIWCKHSPGKLILCCRL